MGKIYSRDFGGIKSDGQLYNLEREYNQSHRYDNYENYEGKAGTSVYTENRTYFLSFSIQSFNSFAAVSLPPTPKAMAPATQKAPRISAKAI